MQIWGKRGSKIMIVPVAPWMSAEKLLEVFAVDPATPWLQAVLAVLAGMEEQGKEQAMIADLKDSERAFYAGGISKMAEAQERILELVKKGNEAKRGTGPFFAQGATQGARRTTDGG